jgi:hypothetical protein
MLAGTVATAGSELVRVISVDPSAAPGPVRYTRLPVICRPPVIELFESDIRMGVMGFTVTVTVFETPFRVAVSVT